MGNHRADSSRDEPPAEDADPADANTPPYTGTDPDDSGTDHDDSGSDPGPGEGALAEPDGPHAEGAPAKLDERRPSARRRVFSIAMVVLGAFIILGGAWTGWRAYQAYSHLDTARIIVSDMDAHVQSTGIDDLAGLTTQAGQFAKETSAARSAVDDPIYRLATFIPVLGDNLDAVRDVAVSMDGIAQAAQTGMPNLEPLADHASWASGGHFDLAVLRPAAAAVKGLNDAVQRAVVTAGGLNRSRLVGPVNNALNEYGTQLTKLSEMTSAGAKAAKIVMPILGADGPRTYLIAFQNLAESRATGGIFGFYVDLLVDDGTLTIGPAGSSDRDFGPFDKPVAGVDPSIMKLYGDGMNIYPQNVNLRPGFGTGAATFAEMYRATTGRTVDGVIAMDPVVVATLMQGIAPIDMGHGLTLSSDTAVQVLLSGIYDVFPGGNELDKRDALMKSTMETAFSAVIRNLTNLGQKELLKDLTSLIDQRRVLLWSAHPEEQGTIAATAVGGEFTHDQPGQPSVGVFFNDATAAKLDYYLQPSMTLGSPTCTADGQADAPLRITLANSIPASGLPNYVLGASNIGKPPVMVTNVVLVSPTGGGLTNVTVDGKPATVRAGMDGNRTIAIITVRALSGQTVTIGATVAIPADNNAAPDGQVAPRLITTPMARPFETSTTTYSSCAAP